MPYEFAYGVRDQYTGNDYNHAQKSDGNTVTGEYQVLLPDGRKQIVTYTADHYNGFVAKVSGGAFHTTLYDSSSSTKKLLLLLLLLSYYFGWK